MDQPPAPPSQVRTRFTWCALALLALSVAPVWLAPALPMQDYPQHLFITAVLRPEARPQWLEAYDRQLTPTPYTGFYWFAYALAPLFGLDGAGRAFITLYFLLFGLWLWRLARSTPTPPWAALLVWPFALAPPYFHGFVNYLLALPLLLLALQGLRRGASERLGPRPLAVHAALLLTIVWFHPLCLYVYAGLGALELSLTQGSATPGWLRALPGALVLALLGAWQAYAYHDAQSLVWWAPSVDTLRYLGLLFAGPRGGLLAALHASCMFVAMAALALHRPWRALDRRDMAHAAALLIAYLALPFRVGSYTYVSWRLLPLLGFALASGLGHVPLPRRTGALVALACLLLTADGALLQLQVGRETAEILPLVSRVQPSARVTTINFSTDSRYLDARYFGSQHQHDFYYYVLQAGGLCPFLWSDPLIPVRKRGTLTLSAPRSLQELRAQDYGVVFSRGANAQLARILEHSYQMRGQYGAWTAFERRRVK